MLFPCSNSISLPRLLPSATTYAHDLQQRFKSKVGAPSSSRLQAPVFRTPSMQPKRAFVAAGLATLVSAQRLSSPLHIVSALKAIQDAVPTQRVQTFPQATSSLASAFASPTDYIDSAVSLIRAGFNPDDIESIVEGYLPADSSIDNINPRSPPRPIYPRASPADPAYSVSESSLRGAIRIPAPFTFGQKPPVILFPGTGVSGGMTFAYNYGRLLAEKSFADPVWVNIPQFSLADAQATAEYAAYAINYISGITNRNVSVVTFSQGSLNVQWAFKYWRSARSLTTNLVALSPNYYGTDNARLLCPPVIGPCTPAVLQQYYNSTFVHTLLADGGDSAYVPTTNVRSATDQIVQPQTGARASGVLKDAHGVGVTNILVQDVCPLQPAGTLTTHEGMLYNSLAYELALDALRTEGTGQLSRVENLSGVCSDVVAEGMSLNDLVATEASFVVFLTNFLLYLPKVFAEPAIKAYAASG